MDSSNLDSPNGHSRFEGASEVSGASTSREHSNGHSPEMPPLDARRLNLEAGTAVQLPLAPPSQLDPAVVEVAGHLVAVLFVSGGPLTLGEAARAIGVSASVLQESIQYLRQQPPLGLMLQIHGDELELVSHPRSAPCVRTLLGLDRPVRLSRAALETLSIVAYRQPVTRGEVEAIRGVNSDGAVTTLLNRGLIEQVGRRETVGRPTLYGTTPEFLQHLGIDSLDALPPLPQQPDATKS